MSGEGGLLAESRTRLSAVTKAIRTAGRMKGGTSCNMGTGYRNSATKSIASSVTPAISGTPAEARVQANRGPRSPVSLAKHALRSPGAELGGRASC